MKAAAARPPALPVVAIAIALAAGGCTVGPTYERPALAVPADWRTPTTVSATAADGAWWTSFGDPAIDALVAEALASSPDIAIAAARVDEYLGRYGQTPRRAVPRGRTRTRLDAGLAPAREPPRGRHPRRCRRRVLALRGGVERLLGARPVGEAQALDRRRARRPARPGGGAPRRRGLAGRAGRLRLRRAARPGPPARDHAGDARLARGIAAHLRSALPRRRDLRAPARAGARRVPGGGRRGAAAADPDRAAGEPAREARRPQSRTDRARQAADRARAAADPRRAAVRPPRAPSGPPARRAGPDRGERAHRRGPRALLSADLADGGAGRHDRSSPTS